MFKDMDVKIQEQDSVMTASLIGRLDTAAAIEVTKALQPMLDNAGKTLVMDCSEMSYISSSGLRIFLTLRKAAAAAGGKVIVRGMNPDIRQIFMMTGFLNLFEVE